MTLGRQGITHNRRFSGTRLPQCIGKPPREWLRRKLFLDKMPGIFSQPAAGFRLAAKPFDCRGQGLAVAGRNHQAGLSRFDKIPDTIGVAHDASLPHRSRFEDGADAAGIPGMCDKRHHNKIAVCIKGPQRRGGHPRREKLDLRPVRRFRVSTASRS